MILCDRCRRLLDDFKTFVKTITARFVQKVRNVSKRLSECCCAKKVFVFDEKLDILRQNDAKTAPARAAHLDAGK